MFKRNNVLFLMVFTAFNVYAQTAEEIYSRVTVVKSNEYYQEQAKIWKKMADVNPKNANAWFNYYKAKRNIQTLKATDNVHAENRFQELNNIVSQVNKNCPNSFEAHYLNWKNSNSNPAYFQELQKAFDLDSNRTDYFPDFVIYHEIMGNYPQKNYFLKKWAQSKVVSPGLLNYAYNMLIGLDSNSIILTGGDNDTYYPWLIQEAFGIRKDVKVINIHLAFKQNVLDRYAQEIGMDFINLNNMNFKTFQFHLFENLKKIKIAGMNSQHNGFSIDFKSNSIKIPQNPELYDKSKFKMGGIYLATTCQLDSMEANDYFKLNLVGLASEFSLYPSGVKALNNLIQNYDQRFRLDDLTQTFSHDLSQSIVDQVNGNYLPILFQLYEHFDKIDASKALKIKKLAFSIAKKCNQVKIVEAYLGSEN